MGVIRNIKSSIDDKSSMSVNNITLLASAIMGIVIGIVLCFILVYDVVYDGRVDTDMGDMAMFLMASGAYIMGSGIPKAWVDSRMKTRSWVENEKMQIEAEEDLEDLRSDRRMSRRRKNQKDSVIDMEGEEINSDEDV